ncbi:hypothetical protein KAW80_03390 [Candidatus Babeliales bacterium]|nr:hypothetical protein [Candidatus Babeliales bacterium]
MKKSFIVLCLLFSSNYLNANKTNPLKDNYCVNTIFSGIGSSSKAGAFVKEIKDSGECAKTTIRFLNVMKRCNTEKDLLKLKSDIEKSFSQKITFSTTNEDMSLEEKNLVIKQEVFNFLKSQLLDPRAEFFGLLHEFSYLLKEPVKLSLGKSNKIDLDNSIILGFLTTPKENAHKYLPEKLNDSASLKKVCFEFVIFCHDLWGVVPDSLMHKWHLWLKENENKEIN